MLCWNYIPKVLNPSPAELMQATIQEHGLQFQRSLHQCIAPGNPNWTKRTQLPECQGMLLVCHGWSRKEGRWQFGLLTKNQDKWALLEGIIQSACFHCILWAEFEFLSMSITSWELLPPRCSPWFMKNKQKIQKTPPKNPEKTYKHSSSISQIVRFIMIWITSSGNSSTTF